ncbi:hypothetical protein BDW67DRAFT_155258 [Aspergillus spinulosporus]
MLGFLCMPFQVLLSMSAIRTLYDCKSPHPVAKEPCGQTGLLRKKPVQTWEVPEAVPGTLCSPLRLTAVFYLSFSWLLQAQAAKTLVWGTRQLLNRPSRFRRIVCSFQPTIAAEPADCSEKMFKQ